MPPVLLEVFVSSQAPSCPVTCSASCLDMPGIALQLCMLFPTLISSLQILDR